MFKVIAAAAALSVVSSGVVSVAYPQTQRPGQTSRIVTTFGLERSQPVVLRLTETLSSAEAKTGQPVHLVVASNVDVNGKPVILAGANVTATISATHGPQRLNRDGYLEILVSQVELADGEAVSLTSEEEERTKAPQFLQPVMPIFNASGISRFGTGFLDKGYDTALPEGTEFTAYVAADKPLDSSKFPDPATPSTIKSPADKKVSLTITTNQTDGDVYIDGNYRGEAPATVKLTRGMHFVEVHKSGFRDWRQNVVAAGDPLKLNVTFTPQH